MAADWGQLRQLRSPARLYGDADEAIAMVVGQWRRRRSPRSASSLQRAAYWDSRIEGTSESPWHCLCEEGPSRPSRRRVSEVRGDLRLAWRDVEISESLESRDFWACPRCNSRWTSLPIDVGTRDYYLTKPADDHERLEQGTSRFRRVRAAIERELRSTRYLILDVGCAQGAHLMAYPSTVTKAGVEPSLSARPVLVRRGVEWLGADLQEVDPLYSSTLSRPSTCSSMSRIPQKRRP